MRPFAGDPECPIAGLPDVAMNSGLPTSTRAKRCTPVSANRMPAPGARSAVVRFAQPFLHFCFLCYRYETLATLQCLLELRKN